MRKNSRKRKYLVSLIQYPFYKNMKIQHALIMAGGRGSRMKKNDIYCSGIQVLNPAKINSLMEPCDNFYQLWQNLINDRKLCCSNIYPEKWFAVDTLAQLNLVNGR